MRFLYLAGLIATASAVAPAKTAKTSLEAADPHVDLIGAPDRDAHKGRTNPDAVQDGWPDCAVPDKHKFYFTQCSPVASKGHQQRLVILGTSFTSGVGVGSRKDTWPSHLQAARPGEAAGGSSRVGARRGKARGGGTDDAQPGEDGGA